MKHFYKHLIPSLLILASGCSSTPRLVALPCPKPPSLPAELSTPPRSPIALQNLSDYLKSPLTRVPPMPNN